MASKMTQAYKAKRACRNDIHRIDRLEWSNPKNIVCWRVKVCGDLPMGWKEDGREPGVDIWEPIRYEFPDGSALIFTAYGNLKFGIHNDHLKTVIKEEYWGEVNIEEKGNGGIVRDRQTMFEACGSHREECAKPAA